MARGVKLTKDKVAQMIVKKAGNISEVARAMKVSRKAVYAKINQHEDLAELLADTRAELIDLAESKLRSQIDKENITAIIFTLKTQGRNRGYIEKLDLNISSEVQSILPTLLKEIEKAGLEAPDVLSSMLDVIRSADADS